jgi:hypothetical protein
MKNGSEVNPEPFFIYQPLAMFSAIIPIRRSRASTLAQAM